MSDTYSVIYSPEARSDIKDIYSYIAFELLVPGTAEGQVSRIRKTIRSLDFMPSRNSLLPNITKRCVQLKRSVI